MIRDARRLLLALTLATLAGFSGASAVTGSGDEVRISAALDRDTIGLDEEALLQIELSGPSQNLPAPDLPSLPRFDVYSQGRSSSIQIVNGQVSSSVTHRYLLVPNKAGTYPIDQIAVVYNNKRYKANPLTLTVLDKGTATSRKLEEQAADAGGSGRDYFLQAEVDKTRPYVGQQVTLTLKFYIAVQHYGSPKLIDPTTTGFWTEPLGNRPMYRQSIGGRTYRVFEIQYALFPTQTGELTIGRATVRAKVADRTTRSRDPFGMFDDFFSSGREVSVRSAPVTLNVRPLPQEGRPGDFTGSVGDFEISASADKRSVEVNQPLTVTIKIQGKGNIKSVAKPTIPELDDFRMYEASATENVANLQGVIGGTMTYEEVFIPRVPGDLEIPSIEYSFFDPDRNQYRRASTRPISVRVTKPEGWTGPSDIPYNPSVIVGSEARDIRYIKQSPGEVSAPGEMVLLSPLYIIVNGLPVLVLAGLVVVRRRREKLAANTGLARSLQAGKMARKRLARARSLANVETGSEFYADLHLTLTSYIADKLNISPYGLTTDRIRDLLRERGAEEDLIADTIDVLQRCDFARFAPATINKEDIDKALQEGEQVMIRLEGIRFV